MIELIPIIFASIVLLILSGLVILFFKLLNRRWWSRRWIRRAAYLLPVGGIVGITVWGIGVYALHKTVSTIGATLTAADLIIIFSLLLSLPVSGAFNIVFDIVDRKKGHQSASGRTARSGSNGTEMPRRRFLKAIAAGIPLSALISGASGVAAAFNDVNVYLRPMMLANLPPELDGFRILHITDIHIGHYTWLDDVVAVLERARQFSPDIIIATGDLCDRTDEYGALLGLLDQFRAPLGAYASIGNHEYFRGIRKIRRAFDSGPVPLLLNNGLTIEDEGRRLFLGGADDPRRLSSMESDFFSRTIDAAMSLAPPEVFRILLSHRPNAFDEAARRGINLTLSGHTHGGQLGMGGRSIFQPMMTESYLWGPFRKGKSHLYTSSGVGHWFPFRLGCPAEAPILELKRGSSA